MARVYRTNDKTGYPVTVLDDECSLLGGGTTLNAEFMLGVNKGETNSRHGDSGVELSPNELLVVLKEVAAGSSAAFTSA